MLWRALFLILWLAAPTAADEIPPSGAQTDRLLYQLDGLSQALDHLESFRAAFPDPATADAYLAAWREMIEANALLYASRDSLPGPAYADYDQTLRPMVARIREATEILAHLQAEANWQGAPLFPFPFELHQPTQQAVDASGLDPAGYLVQIMIEDRPEPFRLPGLQATVALTLHHPPDLSLPLAWSWPASAVAPAAMLEIGNPTGAQGMSVSLQLSAPGVVFEPVPDAAATTRCVPHADRMECDADLPAGAPLRLIIPLRPATAPETLPAPYDRDVTISVTGTATAPGETRIDLPPASIALPFRSCNAALAAGLAAFFEDPAPPANWSHRLAVLAHVAPRPDLPGRLTYRAPLPQRAGPSLAEILQNGWPAPTPPPEFEDLGPREQAALIARQAATNRGPDNRLLEIGRMIAANSPALEGLRSFDRACPASSEDIPVVAVQLSELEQLFRAVSEARAEIEALYDAAARERDQQSRAFYEALAQSGAEEGGLLRHIDMPEDPNRFGEELYPGERLFVPIYRAIYNAGFYGLLSITSHAARAQATRSLLGPVSIATSVWNTGSEIQSYQTVRIQMGAALGWVELAAYLRQLRDRYEGLEAELTRIRTDFRTLHRTACACRFE
ncbi:hypothetical protein [Nioella sp. MMSF_3534]|uniref:hypothetical protein n=1 Tax=Nioella sp. MMSF_3534 TaxID=3046720 RepID=UPI00273D4675|nr:hypothetical protein [Nioella sp. MMSF_3534]